MASPSECRDLADVLARHAGKAVHAAIAAAGNDRNRDPRDRQIVHGLYRKIAIDDANELLRSLHATRDEREIR